MPFLVPRELKNRYKKEEEEEAARERSLPKGSEGGKAPESQEQGPRAHSPLRAHPSLSWATSPAPLNPGGAT